MKIWCDKPDRVTQPQFLYSYKETLFYDVVCITTLTRIDSTLPFLVH